MNTFRTISRVLVVTAAVFVSNATAVDLNPLISSLASVVNNQNVNMVLKTGVGVAGGLWAYDQIKKQNPYVVSGVTGLTVGALTGNATAGVLAAGGCFGTSVVRTVVPNTDVAKPVTDKLPASFTSEEAKLAAQVLTVVGGAVLYYGLTK